MAMLWDLYNAVVAPSQPRSVILALHDGSSDVKRRIRGSILVSASDLEGAIGGSESKKEDGKGKKKAKPAHRELEHFLKSYFVGPNEELWEDREEARRVVLLSSDSTLFVQSLAELLTQFTARVEGYMKVPIRDPPKSEPSSSRQLVSFANAFRKVFPSAVFLCFPEESTQSFHRLFPFLTTPATSHANPCDGQLVCSWDKHPDLSDEVVAEKYPSSLGLSRFVDGSDSSDGSGFFTGEVFIGNQDSALSQTVLKDLNVKRVVNATVEVDSPFSDDETEKMMYFRVGIYDKPDAVFGDQLVDATNFMASGVEHGENLLVHCQKGQSRSAAVCVAYLLVHRRFPLPEALSMLLDARPTVAPNKGFRKQLCELHEQQSGEALGVEDLKLLWSTRSLKKRLQTNDEL